MGVSINGGPKMVGLIMETPIMTGGTPISGTSRVFHHPTELRLVSTGLNLSSHHFMNSMWLKKYLPILSPMVFPLQKGRTPGRRTV